MRRNEELLSAVLEEAWDNAVPVNPIRIAEALGIKVWKNPKLSGIDGVFMRDKGIPSIIYRPTGDRLMDKFVIAHEIGHFRLGHGHRRCVPECFLNACPDALEDAANSFARRLLMPKKAVDYAVRVSPMNTVAEIAAYFDVAEAVARTRLKEMGYLD